MTGFLETQTINNQVEALYIAYLNRAGDGPGVQYWDNAGMTPTQIAASFAVQPEAGSMANVTAVVQAAYTNLFSHTADAAGLAYWTGQITNGTVAIGSAVYAIANGAIGNDATILTDKIQAAAYFTNRTFVTNLGTTQPLDPTFLTQAHNAVVNVVDTATEQASETAANHFALPGGPALPTAMVQVVGQAGVTDTAHHGA